MARVRGRSGSAGARLLLLAGSTAFFFGIAELLAYVLMVAPDGFSFTLAAQRWKGRYWHPTNSLGYRDAERDAAGVAGRRVLLAVGDSIVAGAGIEDPADRFPDVLGGLLGPDWVVVNAARSGWGTAEQHRAIRAHPLAPDAIVLSYYANDVQGAADRAGRPRPPLVRPPPLLLRPAVEHSYFFNLVYWRLIRFADFGAMGRAYWSYLVDAYRDEGVWALHREELLAIVGHARTEDLPLVVVVFPYLLNLDESQALTDRVVELMRDRGVPVLDLAPALRGRDPATLVVSPLDVHPNEALHREVAELLYPLVAASRDSADSASAMPRSWRGESR